MTTRSKTTTQRAARRTESLSKERIVEVAIEILDSEGESALTFRALGARLSTGPGALYWHVADKDDLLAATSRSVIGRALTEVADDALPREAIREIAVGVFDAVDEHPWVGAHFAREPWQSTVPQIFESIGAQLPALGVREEALFDTASALVSYIVGVAGQNAANGRLVARGMDRTTFLENVAAQWTEEDFPFLHRLAPQLPSHDDREQFLAGVDLILAGIAALR